MTFQSLLSADDLHLYNEGTHYRLFEKLGAHPGRMDGVDGTYFAVWAPDAERVSVVGDFNGWDGNSHEMHSREQSGIWEIFLPGVGQGSLYKYRIFSRYGGYTIDKSDPLAIASEPPPRTASMVWDLDYAWND